MSQLDSWRRQLACEREDLADAEKKSAAALKNIGRLEKKIAAAERRGR